MPFSRFTMAFQLFAFKANAVRVAGAGVAASAVAGGGSLIASAASGVKSLTPKLTRRTGGTPSPARRARGAAVGVAGVHTPLTSARGGVDVAVRPMPDLSL